MQFDDDAQLDAGQVSDQRGRRSGGGLGGLGGVGGGMPGGKGGLLGVILALIAAAVGVPLYLTEEGGSSALPPAPSARTTRRWRASAGPAPTPTPTTTAASWRS